MVPTVKEVPQAVAFGQPNPRNNPIMFKIFQNAQFNIIQHKKYVKEMTKLYKKTKRDDFTESFKNALYYIFTFGDASAYVDRIVQFVATFCTSFNEEEGILMSTFDIIFNCQCVSSQSVRYRASQLLGAILASLGDDASLDEELCDKLLTFQMQRLQDTRGAVRCRAALSLNRLQNPSDPEDRVTRAYRFHMCCDPSSSVRRAIVMSIAKGSRNVPFVLERLCDVDEAVRRSAFLYISSMNVTQLRVKQRILILKIGLTERNQRVRRVVEEILIPSWLSTYKGNIIEFLEAVRLDNSNDAKDSQYVAGKLLESLFKRLPIPELLEWLPTDKPLQLIPAEKLNKETVWYWRHLAEHLMKNNNEEALETVLPDLTVLTGYIKAIVESPCPSEAEDPVAFRTRQYVLHELARLLGVYDTSDPAGRDAVQTLITETLTGDYALKEEVIRAFVSALQLIVPDVTSRVELICTIVSTLREPLDLEEDVPPPTIDCTEFKLQRARLRVSLNVAMEAQEEAVRDENYTLAAECKAKVADIQKKLEELNTQSQSPTKPPLHTIKEQCDVAIINKCLLILNALLDTPQLKTVTPMLKILFSELEADIFKNSELLENSLKTIALLGMLDKEFAKEHKSFFFAHLIDSSNERLVCTILKCIIDLMCVHGAKVFEDDEFKNNTGGLTKSSMDAPNADESFSHDIILPTPTIYYNVTDLMLKLMDSACPAYRLIIVEGFCRLIYLGHIESPDILSKLVILWFNPATADEDVLRQTIGIFFQTFPSNVDGAQEQIQKAIIPTLRIMCWAPSNSPLSIMDQEAVVKFLVSLTRVSHELLDTQGDMALVLCSHLASRPSGREATLVCRALALLSPPKDARLAADISATLRNLFPKLDKQSCRQLTRYLGTLEAIERNNLNKTSNIGVTTDTIQTEDTINMERSRSILPQPLARSTHVIVNETVQEEPDIDETSPNNTESNSKISEENKNQKEDTTSVHQTEKLSTSTNSSGSDSSGSDSSGSDSSGSDSSGVSPVKKVKVAKGKKRNISLKKDSNKEEKPTRNKNAKENVTKEKQNKGIKRSHSQRSLVDIEKSILTRESRSSQKLQQSSQDDELVVSNNVRRSNRSLQSGSSTDSTESKGKEKNTQEKTGRTSSQSSQHSTASAQLDSDDDTTLHTIIYDTHTELGVLDDSGELMDSRRSSKANITIPETPDASDESESEIEETVKGKGKSKRK